MRIGRLLLSTPPYFETDDSGKIAQKYPDEAFLHAVELYEPASTAEVAKDAGCSRRNANFRLQSLEEAGDVESKMIGNSLSWMLAK